MSEAEVIVAGLKKGEEAEKKVFEALAFLEIQKFINKFKFAQTMPFSKDDYRGIDFYIYWGRKVIKLQVKSSLPKRKEQEYLRRRGIFLLICKPEDDLPRVLKKIYNILKAAKRVKTHPFLFF